MLAATVSAAMHPTCCVALAVPPAYPPCLSHPCPWQAIGVPIARLALYTACGGIVPSACLPVTIDAGTDNEALLQVRDTGVEAH